MKKRADLDEISNANTEDGLLRNSFETIDDERLPKCGASSKSPLYHMGMGIFLMLMGICTLIWTPFNILMSERLKMMPGLPPYECWKNPPDEVLLRTFIFNVTNAEEFLRKDNVKLNFEEIGPIVFMEKLTHSNIIFNDNDTLTYTARREAIYLPEENTIDLNSTIVVPSWALLGLASYFSDHNIFIKMGFNVLVRSIKSEPFVNISIYDLLWNYRDPLLDAAQKIAPFFVPTKNMGILSRIYTNFSNDVNVFIGTENGNEKFFLIDKLDGTEYLPHYGPKCADKVTFSTEGVVYPQYLTKNTTIWYWRKTICKPVPLYYEKNAKRYGIEAYKYVLANDTFNRTWPIVNDCYRGEPPLPNGLSDVHPCHFGFPLASSFPHFLHSAPEVRNYVTGLQPNVERHESFVIVEPTTGIPLYSRARMQSNLIVRSMDGFTSAVKRFANLPLPMFWLEYNQRGLPWYIILIVYFQVNVLPILQSVVSIAFLIIGAIFFYYCRKSFRQHRMQKHHLNDNKALHFAEKEIFIN